LQRPTSAFLRLSTWLGLALALASSTPHVHPAERNGIQEATLASGALDVPGPLDSVTSDDRHDEHSPSPSNESRPCRLCRSSDDLPMDRTRPAVLPARLESIALQRGETPNLHASRFASLHPARAPPHATRA